PDNQPMEWAGLARVKRDWMPGDGLLTLGICSRNVGAMSIGGATRGTLTIDMAKQDWGGARALGLPITLHTSGPSPAHVYGGLVGLLAIGRTDGNLPLVTEKNIPIRNMALQYNFVFDRAGGLAQLNNLNWPQWVSTITPPKPGELANGTYQPSLAPVNFKQSKPGTKFFTVWYSGPLSIHNRRGTFQFIPSNLRHFVAADGKAESDVQRIHRCRITSGMCNSQ